MKPIGIPAKRLLEKAELAVLLLGRLNLAAAASQRNPSSNFAGRWGRPPNYILFGIEEQGNLTAINAMLSGLSPEYIPHVEELLAAYVKSIQLSNR